MGGEDSNYVWSDQSGWDFSKNCWNLSFFRGYSWTGVWMNVNIC